MTELICEGVCNPNLPAFDETAEVLALIRVREAQRQQVPPSVAEQTIDRLIGLRRTLRHTAHQYIGSDPARGERWACGTCGCERRWGGSALELTDAWSRRKLGRTA